MKFPSTHLATNVSPLPALSCDTNDNRPSSLSSSSGLSTNN
uniref:Uncharacterized protein n=1 Tax=Parascaris equorum TaxID=6256 RepID=A0A914SID8_PAREQ